MSYVLIYGALFFHTLGAQACGGDFLMNEDIKTIADTMRGIGKFFYALIHPIVIWDWFMDISYWLAVFICIVSVILYAATKDRKIFKVAMGNDCYFCLIERN